MNERANQWSTEGERQDAESSLQVLCQFFLWGDDASVVEQGLIQMVRVSPAERKWSAETREPAGAGHSFALCLFSA